MKLTKKIRSRRVAVAMDVIAQIQARKLSVKSEVGYVIEKGAPLEFLSREGDLRDYFDKIAKSCTVCMRGAALLCKARIFDGVPVSSVTTPNGYLLVCRSATENLLSDTFDPMTLSLVECAFERNPELAVSEDFGPSITFVEAMELIEKAVSFGDKYRYDGRRCIAVMQNIIDNNGEFKP